MARLTVAQVKELHNFAWKYEIVERNGNEHMNFYYEECEYEDYQKEIANASANGVLVAYGARFMAR